MRYNEEIPLCRKFRLTIRFYSIQLICNEFAALLLASLAVLDLILIKPIQGLDGRWGASKMKTRIAYGLEKRILINNRLRFKISEKKQGASQVARRFWLSVLRPSNFHFPLPCGALEYREEAERSADGSFLFQFFQS